MPALCEIGNARPAVAQVTVVQDGKRKSLSICDYDYRQLMRHQSMINPFDSLPRLAIGRSSVLAS
jgi:ATP-dependent Clp protease ATP-binding subunit ClpC